MVIFNTHDLRCPIGKGEKSLQKCAHLAIDLRYERTLHSIRYFYSIVPGKKCANFVDFLSLTEFSPLNAMIFSTVFKIKFLLTVLIHCQHKGDENHWNHPLTDIV